MNNSHTKYKVSGSKRSVVIEWKRSVTDSTKNKMSPLMNGGDKTTFFPWKETCFI